MTEEFKKRQELWLLEQSKPSEERNPWPDLCEMRTRYILSAIGMEKEVTRADWIRAERSAGFRLKSATDDLTKCATGGFSGYGGVSGRIIHEYVVGTFTIRFDDGDILAWTVYSPDGAAVLFPWKKGKNSLERGFAVGQ